MPSLDCRGGIDVEQTGWLIFLISLFLPTRQTVDDFLAAAFLNHAELIYHFTIKLLCMVWAVYINICLIHELKAKTTHIDPADPTIVHLPRRLLALLALLALLIRLSEEECLAQAGTNNHFIGWDSDLRDRLGKEAAPSTYSVDKVKVGQIGIVERQGIHLGTTLLLRSGALHYKVLFVEPIIITDNL